MAVILKDEDVALLEVDVVLMEGDRVPLRKDLGNVGTVDAIITSPKSAERNFVDLSGHNYLILILLSRVVILRISSSTIPGSSTVVLSQEEYVKLRQLEFSQNNLSTGNVSNKISLHVCLHLT